MSQNRYCIMCDTDVPCKWLTCPNRNGNKHGNRKKACKGNTCK